MISVKDFGAVGDGVANDIEAFEAAIASMDPGTKGDVLLVPPGTYRLSRPLELLKTVIIQGSGSGDVGYSSTVLKFDGSDGVVFSRSGQLTSQWGKLRDLTIQGPQTSGSSGVRLKCRAALSNVHIQGFERGVNVNSDGGLNCNNSELHRVRVTGASSDGVYLKGVDSNACVLSQVDATGNGGWGIWDGSLLGNTMLGCHASANGLGGFYLVNSGAGGMLLNCYTEGGAQPPSHVMSPAVVLGGTHGSGFTPSSTALRLLNRYGVSPFVVSATHPDGKVTQVHLGSEQEPAAGIRLTHTGDGAGLRVGWGNNGWEFGAVNAAAAMRIDKGSNRPTFPLGIQLGGVLAAGRAAPRVWSCWGDPRTTGFNWMARRGDLILNQAANSTERVWICTQDCGWGGKWSPGNGPYTSEVLVTPSVPNGFCYRLASNSPGWWTGSVEPVWPTTIGATVQDGTTVWECFGPTTTGLVPL